MCISSSHLLKSHNVQSLWNLGTLILSTTLSSHFNQWHPILNLATTLMRSNRWSVETNLECLVTSESAENHLMYFKLLNPNWSPLVFSWYGEYIQVHMSYFPGLNHLIHDTFHIHLFHGIQYIKNNPSGYGVVYPYRYSYLPTPGRQTKETTNKEGRC